MPESGAPPTTGGEPESVPASALRALALPRGGWPGSPVVGVEVLVPGEGGRVSWGRNGEIAYSLFDHRVGGVAYPDIWVMSGDGSGRRCLTCANPAVPHLSDDIPVWDPTGRFIVFEAEDPSLGPVPERLAQGGAGFDNNLWAITPDGRRAYELTHVTRGEAVLHPQFSPDGRELVWAAYDRTAAPGSGRWDIHVARLVVSAGGVPSLSDPRVYRPGPTSAATFYETHAVTASGTILFSSNMDSRYEVSCTGCALGIWSWPLGRAAPAAGAVAPRLLTPDTSTWNEHAALSPGGHIAWVTSQGEPFTPSTSWSRTLRTDWWLMDSTGASARRLTYFNAPDRAVRVICADSSWNAAGTELVGTVDVISGAQATSAIVVLRFRGRE